MADPRVLKLANLLVQYCLNVREGHSLFINAGTPGEELALETLKAGVKAGAHVTLHGSFPGADAIYYRYASDEQLRFIPPLMKMYEEYDRILFIFADQNTRAMSGIDPLKRAKWLQANKTWYQLMGNREVKLEWCSTLFPTHAYAQEANMSLPDYQDFIYHAGMLDADDPAEAWTRLSAKMQVVADRLNRGSEILLKGSDVDLRLKCAGRKFMVDDGKANFPGGEILNCPLEDSAEGWIRFRYPARMMGEEITNMQMWFEAGKVIKETADRGQNALTTMLNTDSGARYLGEFAIGTNYHVTRPIGHMLIDEKMGGTIHIALGEGFPELGGENHSGLHWDILCDMSESEIQVDGEVIYRNGKPIDW